jgi:hypothetical protein
LKKLLLIILVFCFQLHANDLELWSRSNDTETESTNLSKALFKNILLGKTSTRVTNTLGLPFCSKLHLHDTAVNPLLLFSDLVNDIGGITKSIHYKNSKRSKRIKICSKSLVTFNQSEMYDEGMALLACPFASTVGFALPFEHIYLKIDDYMIDQNSSSFGIYKYDRSYTHKGDNCLEVPLKDNESELLKIEKIHCLVNEFKTPYNLFNNNCGSFSTSLLQSVAIGNPSFFNLGIGTEFKKTNPEIVRQLENGNNKCDEHIDNVTTFFNLLLEQKGDDYENGDNFLKALHKALSGPSPDLLMQLMALHIRIPTNSKQFEPMKKVLLNTLSSKLFLTKSTKNTRYYTYKDYLSEFHLNAKSETYRTATSMFKDLSEEQRKIALTTYPFLKDFIESSYK